MPLFTEGVHLTDIKRELIYLCLSFYFTPWQCKRLPCRERHTELKWIVFDSWIWICCLALGVALILCWNETAFMFLCNLLQRSCVHWWSQRPFQKTLACLNVWPSTPSARSPAQQSWKFTTVRCPLICYHNLSVTRSLAELYNTMKITSLAIRVPHLLFCTPPCRPGGAAGDWGHTSAGSSFSQGAEGGGVPTRDFLLHKEQRGLSRWATWLNDPPPSWVAWQPCRRSNPCRRVSRCWTHIQTQNTHQFHFFYDLQCCSYGKLLSITNC